MITRVIYLICVVSSFMKLGDAIMCHRCNSAMGGCGSDGVVWRMFPWRDCGDSKFCVKSVTYKNGEAKIIRECENELMKSGYHRLRMPVLRRHGYCEPARKNDFWNPTQTTDPDVQYCFCNDWNGCNSARNIFSNVAQVISLGLILLFLARKIAMWEMDQAYFDLRLFGIRMCFWHNRLPCEWWTTYCCIFWYTLQTLCLSGMFNNIFDELYSEDYRWHRGTTFYFCIVTVSVWFLN